MEVNKCFASALHGCLYRAARSKIQSRCMHDRITGIYKINCSNQCFFMRAILIKKGN